MKNTILIFVFVVFIPCIANASSKQRDNLTALPGQQSGTEKINTLIELSDSLVYAFPEQAKQYADSAISLSVSVQNLALRYKALKARGYAHGYAGNIAASIADMQKGLNYYISISDSVKIAEALSDLGYLDQAKGLYSKALEKYQQSLAMREQIADLKGIAYSLNNMGALYYRLQKLDEALEYYFRAISYFEQAGLDEEFAVTTGNIGVIYSDQGNNELALFYLNKALVLNRRLGHRFFEAQDLNNIGIVYLNKDEAATALQYFEQALEIHKNIEKNDNHTLILHNLGRAYLVENQLKKALSYFEQAAETASKYQSNDILMHSLNQSATVLHQLGRDSQAYQRILEANNIKDSIFNIRQTEQIEELKAKFDTERYVLENNSLKQSNEKNQIIIQQHKIMFLLYILISLMLLIFIWVLLKKQRSDEKLKALEMEQKLLRSQMNPHFIFNSLTVIQHYILNKSTRQALNQLSALATLMRLILENSKLDFIPFAKEMQTLRLYLDLQQQRFTGQFDYSLELDPTLEESSLSVPPMILQPFIENAIEHGFKGLSEKGMIQLRYTLDDKVLRCEIEDNGIGLESSLASKTGTEFKSYGINITLQRIHILERKYKMNAQFELIDKSQQQGQGTLVRLLLPIKK